MRISLVVGEKDFFLEHNRRFHEELRRHRIPHEFHSVRNLGHDYAPFYSGPGERSFAFYARAFAPVVGPYPDAGNPT